MAQPGSDAQEQLQAAYRCCERSHALAIWMRELSAMSQDRVARSRDLLSRLDRAERLLAAKDPRD